MYVGWDWASESHDVTVVDQDAKVLFHAEVEHSEAGLESILRRLRRLGQPAELPVAIERPSGLIVERLLDQGHPVVAVHPNAFNAVRPRWGASGAKSDPGDSYRLADFLRTDGHRLRRIEPPTEITRNLQALVRTRDDQVEARIAATNQLEALLGAHWPGAAAVFGRLDSEIALAFLTTYPTPESAAHLGEGRMARFLRRHSYCGRRSPAELLNRLRAAPVAPRRLDPEVLGEIVLSQVRVLRTLLAAIAKLDRAIAALVPEHPKAAVLAPLPRIGQGVNLGQVLAEVGPILDRARSVEQAAAECGASPVTKASGKARSVHFRWAANSRARQALQTWVDNSRHSSAWAAHTYAQARDSRKRHPHAIRILMRAWLRVIWACWHSDTPYDPACHRAERQLQGVPTP
ncbi:MAG: IS110 family transposase [Candidatus Dormibacteraeota bacterium]|nr:IS110 family transposase [Candidatus Dormibacteraeota bacterium]